MKRALLLGEVPGQELGYEYVQEPPYEAVVIGSMSLGQLLCFREERVLMALGEGKPVYLYTPGLPQSKNRVLAARLMAARRELKSWGILFINGRRRQLITGAEARHLRRLGRLPEFDAVLTPLAREILGGSE